MDFFQAAILGVVEGVSEFLPISSTGHLILVTRLLNIEQSAFVKSLEIYIQLGAILAVVFLYFKTLIRNISYWKSLAVAFIPTAIVGLLFYKYIKLYLLGNVVLTLVALFVGGILLIVFEKFHKSNRQIEDIEKISLKQALLVGVAQSLSVIPGVSRSAASIVGGVLVGLGRKQAVEFSFILAIPTMMAATILDLLKNDFNFEADELGILGVGFVSAFITALFAIKFFLNYIKRNSFVGFGVYRIVLALLFWFFVLRG